MKEYILVNAYKDKYDRPIDIELLKVGCLNVLQKYLINILKVETSNKVYIESKIENKELYINTNGDEYIEILYENNEFVGYRIPCYSTNEYCGESYLILEKE
ncbi:MAG: hypothetical protein RRY22_04200 [Bacilli bacterium]